MEDRETALEIVAAAQETKAEDILLIDLERQSSITDFVMICSGRSQGHARGICDKIEERLKKLGVRPQTMEGYREGSWILLDYQVVIAHVFHPETRRYYDLEALLAKHPREAFSSDSPTTGLPEPVASQPGVIDSGAVDENATTA